MSDRYEDDIPVYSEHGFSHVPDCSDIDFELSIVRCMECAHDVSDSFFQRVFPICRRVLQNIESKSGRNLAALIPPEEGVSEAYGLMKKKFIKKLHTFPEVEPTWTDVFRDLQHVEGYVGCTFYGRIVIIQGGKNKIQLVKSGIDIDQSTSELVPPKEMIEDRLPDQLLENLRSHAIEYVKGEAEPILVDIFESHPYEKRLPRGMYDSMMSKHGYTKSKDCLKNQVSRFKKKLGERLAPLIPNSLREFKKIDQKLFGQVLIELAFEKSSEEVENISIFRAIEDIAFDPTSKSSQEALDHYPELAEVFRFSQTDVLQNLKKLDSISMAESRGGSISLFMALANLNTYLISQQNDSLLRRIHGLYKLLPPDEILHAPPIDQLNSKEVCAFLLDHHEYAFASLAPSTLTTHEARIACHYVTALILAFERYWLKDDQKDMLDALNYVLTWFD